MEHSFWHNKWDLNQVGFHLDYVHPILQRNLKLLEVKPLEVKKVFVPLCGKTLDIGYLLEQGYDVVAVELSEIAISTVFQQLGLEHEILSCSHGKLYKGDRLTIYVGDSFALSQTDLGEVTSVYSRADIISLQ